MAELSLFGNDSRAIYRASYLVVQLSVTEFSTKHSTDNDNMTSPDKVAFGLRTALMQLFNMGKQFHAQQGHKGNFLSEIFLCAIFL